MSSEIAGTSDTASQQASTSPGDGSEVSNVQSDQGGQNVAQGSSRKVPFKEQVVGYAKVTRGTLLGKRGLKEQGEKILEGNAMVGEPSEM